MMTHADAALRRRRGGLLALACMLPPWRLAQSDTRLLEAVKRGDRKAVAGARRARANVNAAEADGTTALHWAVRTATRRLARCCLSAAPTRRPATATA